MGLLISFIVDSDRSRGSQMDRCFKHYFVRSFRTVLLQQAYRILNCHPSLINSVVKLLLLQAPRISHWRGLALLGLVNWN